MRSHHPAESGLTAESGLAAQLRALPTRPNLTFPNNLARNLICSEFSYASKPHDSNNAISSLETAARELRAKLRQHSTGMPHEPERRDLTSTGNGNRSTRIGSRHPDRLATSGYANKLSGCSLPIHIFTTYPHVRAPRASPSLITSLTTRTSMARATARGSG